MCIFLKSISELEQSCSLWYPWFQECALFLQRRIKFDNVDQASRHPLYKVCTENSQETYIFPSIVTVLWRQTIPLFQLRKCRKSSQLSTVQCNLYLVTLLVPAKTVTKSHNVTISNDFTKQIEKWSL